MELGQNIQKFRRMMGLSQEELAEKCEISRQAIAKWENGESAPAIEKLIFLADFFEVTLDELVGRKEDIALLEGFIKRFVPANAIPVGDNDALNTICRFFDFLDKHGFSADDKVSAMKEVFFAGKENG